LIGPPVRADLRELVIGRRARGYVALYRYVAELDTVFVLAGRGQKQAGYTRT
jgi:toxin ParE1/3/4